MFSQVFWFDFKCNLKRTSTWLFFLAFFLVSAVYIAAEGGLIFNVEGGSISYFNSAKGCASILNTIINNSLLGTIVLITIMAPAIQKDFQYNSHSIYFTKPITKFGYIMGRFMSGFLTALVILMGSVLAFVLMCNLPVYVPGRVGSYDLWNYLQGFVYLIIPNTFFVGALFFSIVTYTRNMLSAYITSVVLLMLINNASLLPIDIDNSVIVSLIDPYGNAALNEMTKYWSPEEVNRLSIDFTGYLLYNRILWMTISSLLFLFTYSRFKFQQYASTFSLFKKKDAGATEGETIVPIKYLPIVISIFDTALSIKIWASLTKLEFKNLVKNRYFIVILLLSTCYIFFSYDVTETFGKHLLPTSFRMIDAILAFAFFFGEVIIVFYAGVLVWRERDSRMDEIISATPIKTWVLLLSKIASLVWMYVTIIFYCMLFCILLQLGNGFTDIKPTVYLESLFGYDLVNMAILISFMVSVQVLVNNRYFGYLLCITVIFLLPIAYRSLGIQNSLIRFNSSGAFLPYSDMNGFGHRLFPFVIYKLYWLSFICLLLITSNLMWSRGKEQVFKNRLIFAKNNVKQIHFVGYILGIGCMILLGSFIHHNTHELNKFYSRTEIDSVNGVRLLIFRKPLIIGDSVQMTFSYQYSPEGFKEGDAQTAIVGNGTYLTSRELFPGISYDEKWELVDSVKRIKYDLKPKEKTHSIEDSVFLKNNYVSPDADWIRYECTISTSGDQTAVSSGDLVRKWAENNRNYFHYKMNVPALMYVCFQSGRYEVKTDKWKGIDIEIYYDKLHTYNIETMINGVKKSLDYYSNNFSAYPFKQLRIVEFPRYFDGAQGFANTITFSEGRDFIAAPAFVNGNTADCFFTTAHEVAHQWWGHQVVGANVQGSGLIGEGLAEYGALRLMEKEFGKKAVHTYLKYELDAYLIERAQAENREEILLHCQEQPYIYYNKAAVILYSISDLIGEQQMNNVLKAYIAKTAFQHAPYTTTLEFENILKSVVADSLKYAIVDGFEKIALYENRTKDVSFVKLPSGKYKVSINIVAIKWYVDGNGKTTEAIMNDYIDIGIFGKGKTSKNPIELYNRKHKIKSGLNMFEMYPSIVPRLVI